MFRKVTLVLLGIFACAFSWADQITLTPVAPYTGTTIAGGKAVYDVNYTADSDITGSLTVTIQFPADLEVVAGETTVSLAGSFPTNEAFGDDKWQLGNTDFSGTLTLVAAGETEKVGTITFLVKEDTLPSSLDLNLEDPTTGYDTFPVKVATISVVKLYSADDDTVPAINEGSAFITLSGGTADPIDVLANDDLFEAAVGKPIDIVGVSDEDDNFNATNSASEKGGQVRIEAGVLSYKPQLDFFGTDTFYYQGRVNVGTELEPDYVYDTAKVTITVNNVNDAPVIGAVADVEVDEDAANKVVTLTATDADNTVAPGTDTLTFEAQSADEALVLASVDGDQLTLNFVDDAFGTTTVTVTVSDGKGGENEKSFDVTVNAVNDAPSFTVGADKITQENDNSVQSFANWATDISEGADNESDQTVSFVITGNTNPGMFLVPPAVSADGTLTYTIDPDTSETDNRVATIGIKITDDGGTDNDGVDSSALQQFKITATVQNDAPVVDATKISVDPQVIVEKDDAIEDITVSVAAGAFVDEEEGEITEIAYQWEINKDGLGWNPISSQTNKTLLAGDRVTAASGFTTYYTVRCLVSVTDNDFLATRAANTVIYGNDLDELNTTVQVGNEPPKLVGNTPGNAVAVVVAENADADFTASFSDKDNTATGDNGMKSMTWSVWKKVPGGDFAEIEDLRETANFTPAPETAQVVEDSFTFSPDQDFQLHEGGVEYQVRVIGTDGQNVPSEALVWNVNVTDVNTQPEIGTTSVVVTVQVPDRTVTDAVTTDTLIATVTTGATDADVEDSGNLTYVVEWYESTTPESILKTDQFTEGVVRQEGFVSSLASTATEKNKTYVAKVTVKDSSEADNDTAEGSVTDTADVVNTLPVVATADAGQQGTTDEDSDVTVTSATLLSANAITDDDEDDISIISANLPSGDGSVTVVSGNIVFDPKMDFQSLGEGQDESVTVSYKVADDEGAAETDPEFTILVTGNNDLPFITSVKLEAQDGAGEKVSTSKPEQIAKIEATIAAGDVDANDSTLTADLVWTLKRKGVETPYQFPVNDVVFTKGEDLAAEVAPTDFTGVTEFLQNDKISLQVVVTDEHSGESAPASKRISIGNPPWFPVVDLNEVAGTEVAEGAYKVTYSNAAEEIVTVYVTVDADKTEIMPIDYLNATWPWEVKGFMNAVDYTITSVKKYSRDTKAYDQTVAIANSAVEVDPYEAPTAEKASEFESVEGSNVFAAEVDINDAAGYKYELALDDAVIVSRTVFFTADNDGAVTTSETVTISETLTKSGNYTLTLLAVNPSFTEETGPVRVASSNKVVWTVEFDAETVTDPIEEGSRPDIDGIDWTGMVPGGGKDYYAFLNGDTTKEPVKVGTADESGSIKVKFSWPVADWATEYVVKIANPDGTDVDGVDSIAVRGGVNTAEMTLEPGIYQWYVIAHNANGYKEQWSAAAWFEVLAADGEETVAIDPVALTIVPGGIANLIKVTDGVANAAYIQVYIYKNGTPFEYIAKVEADTEGDFTVTLGEDMLPGVTYKVYVNAVGDDGKSTGWFAKDVVIGDAK